MTTAQRDLPPIRQGDVYVVPVRFFSDAAKTEPLDVSAQTFEAGLAQSNIGTPEVLFDIDLGDAVDGVIVISLTADDTEDLTARVWRWRLHSTTGDKTWIAGNADVGRSYDLGDTDGPAALDVIVVDGQVIDVTFATGFVFVGTTGDLDELEARVDALEAVDPLTQGEGDARYWPLSTDLATQAELVAAVSAAIDALIDGAPGALNTLNELAAAVNDDASFAAAVTSALAGKQPLHATLTAIAALSTTAFGRALLTLADQPALLAAAGAQPAGTSVPLPTGTPEIDQVPVVTTVSPLALGWGAGGGSSGGLDRVVEAGISSGTYTADLTTGDLFVITLIGNATLAVTGLEVGRYFTVEVHQDSVGGRTLTLPTATGSVSLATTANTFETLVYYSTDGVNLRVHQVSGGAAPTPPSEWAPSDMADKIAWFSNVNLVGADGTAISSWSDGFGLHDVVQATGTKQPLMQTVNGVRVARFDGIDDFLQTASSFASETQPNIIAVLCKVNNPTASPNVVSSSLTGYRNIVLILNPNVAMNAGSNVSSGIANPASYFVAVACFDGASSKIRVNGTEVAGLNPGVEPLRGLTLGANTTGATSKLNGDIVEVIVVGHVPDDTEMANLEAYLQAKRTDILS